MCPSAVADGSLDHACVGVRCVDDLTVSDINADMTFVPYGKSGDFGDGVDSAFLGGVIVHIVSTDIGHSVGGVDDVVGGRLKPPVALDETDTVGGSAAEPVGFDEVCLAADLVGILRFLILEQVLVQHVAVGSPNVAPSFGVSKLCPHHKVCAVFGGGIGIAGAVDIRRTGACHHVGEVSGYDVRSEGCVDSGDQFLVRLLLCKASYQLTCEVRLGSVIVQGEGKQRLCLLNTEGVVACILHGGFYIRPALNRHGLLLGDHLMESVGVDVHAAGEDSEQRHNRHNNDDNDAEDDAAYNLEGFLVRKDVDGYLFESCRYRRAHRPPAFPKMADLYSGAMTCKRYRSLPHRYRQVPRSGYLISSNSLCSTCKASIYSFGLICPALKRN